MPRIVYATYIQAKKGIEMLENSWTDVQQGMPFADAVSNHYLNYGPTSLVSELHRWLR